MMLWMIFIIGILLVLAVLRVADACERQQQLRADGQGQPPSWKSAMEWWESREWESRAEAGARRKREDERRRIDELRLVRLTDPLAGMSYRERLDYYRRLAERPDN